MSISTVVLEEPYPVSQEQSSIRSVQMNGPRSLLASADSMSLLFSPWVLNKEVIQCSPGNRERNFIFFA